MIFEISLAVAAFIVIVLALVFVILAAKSRLVASGNVNITINGEKTIQTPAGSKLLGALADFKIICLVGMWRWWNLRPVQGENF